MDNDELKNLIEKYLAGKCSEYEKAIVESWYFLIAKKKELINESDDQQQLKEEIWRSITKNNQRTRKPLWPYIMAAAASVLIFIVFGLSLSHQQYTQKAQLTQHKDFKPGGSKAVLMLATGEKIVLTKAKNGKIAALGKIQVTKTKDGAVSYVVGKGKGSSKVATGYNMLSTPKGGVFHITLSDGTKVTLDAMSSIRFPSEFIGYTRDVITTGQVYFEVAHDSTKPFRVKTNKQIVEVLGTHFNVSTFESNSLLKTTLLQGSVKVIANGKSKLLKPGEQSELNIISNKINVVIGIDTTEAVAWKNGFFHFNNADVKTVMDQISRWYDVEVGYEGDTSRMRFTGKIYKNINASKALHILSLSGMRFKIEGTKIIVKS